MCPVLHKRIHRVGLNLHVDSKRLPWFPDAQFPLILPECGERILNIARTEAFFEDRKKAKLYCQLVALFSDPLSQDFLRQRFLPHVLKKCRIGDYSLQMDENVISVDNGCEQDLTVTETIHPKCSFFFYDNASDFASKLPMLVICGFDTELVVHVVNKKDRKKNGL